MIVSALPADFAFPGPITVIREDVTQLVTLTVEDNDLGDSLYAKFYRDYVPLTQPTPALVDCAEPGPSVDRLRTIDCRPVALCIGVPDTDATLHVVEVMVSDQPFISDSDPEAIGQDTYRAVANKERAGHSLRAWSMSCASSQ